MWNFRKSAARRGLLPPPKYGRTVVTTAFAAVALLLILFAGWLIDRRGASEAETRLADLARTGSDDPAADIAAAVRANRMVFLSDIHASTATKRLAALAIERTAATTGLDVLVLEVASDMQPVIDRYLQSSPEDASILVTNEKAIRAPGAATRAYLDIYRTVWRLNEKLGADQRIHILAADLEGWPPARPLSPADLARRSAEREAHMQERIQSMFDRQPGARTLIFMTGFHALKSGEGVLQSSGATPVQIAWLASRLTQRSPEEVYSFLVDAPASGGGGDVTTYLGTKIGGILQRSGVNRIVSMRITSEFDEVKQPLLLRKTPGLSFEIHPRDYDLRAVADAYIRLR